MQAVAINHHLMFSASMASSEGIFLCSTNNRMRQICVPSESHCLNLFCFQCFMREELW